MPRPITGHVLLVLSLLAGCSLEFHPPKDQPDGSTDTDTDTDTDADTDSDTDTGSGEPPLTGVDLLIAVDNSGSMLDEQAILAQHLYGSIGVLAADIDEVRVAVVSTDMGLSWGGNPYEDGDGWPDATPPSCGSVGDNGQFMSYSSGKTITLDGEGYNCPILSQYWAETPIGDPPSDNPELPGQAACLTSLGIDGCGWEQHLQSIAVGVNRADQADFHHDDHLLAVIVVSDEDDCSIKSNDLFGVSEIQNQNENRLHLACGNHPEFLYAAANYADTFATPKDGDSDAVLFAAIVGVPIDEQCQGLGSDIPGCLEHPDMQLQEVIENEAYVFAPACQRESVTTARPGRRLVNLAVEYMDHGFVYSICNEDWTAAMTGIAQMISDELDD